MKLVKNIFTVSFFAIMVVAGARAEIVSKTNIVAGDNVAISKPTEGANSGKIVISATDTKYTLPDATADTKGGVRIMTSAGGIDGTSATEDAKVPTVAAAWDIANIAAGNNSVEKEQGTDGANKALITNASGTVTTGTIATNMITDKAVIKGKLAAEVQTSLGKADTAVQTVAPTAATAGKYVTNFTKNGTTVTATTAYVQIPVGSATAPTSVASIWIE